jgi:hypothetical protein
VPAHVPALAAAPTLDALGGDTTPHAAAPTLVSAEQEALTSWVEVRMHQRRRERRTMLGVVGAITALAAAAAGLLFWWQPW